MIEQDFERAKNYLNAAASFYGYGTFDIFMNAELNDKKEVADKILRLAEFLQDQILAAETAVLEQATEAINRPFLPFGVLCGLFHGLNSKFKKNDRQRKNKNCR